MVPCAAARAVFVANPAVDFLDAKNEPKLSEVGGALVNDIGAAKSGGGFHFGIAAADAGAFELEELLEGGGVLALHAGGVEAEVVEGFEVGGVGAEDAGFEAGDAEESPLEVDEFLGEGALGGVVLRRGLAAYRR